MALLPRKVGSVTLMRALGNDGATETFTGILDQPAGKQVIVRKVMPALARDEARYTSLRSRVADLKPIRHPGLLSLLDAFEEDGCLYIVQEWVDAVTLAEIIEWCAENDEPMPHNVFLDLAAQICNGLEALHSRPGVMSGARHVLHLCVRPESISMTRDGDVLLGDYGLVRSPTLAPHSGGIKLKTAYLSPEQTHQDQRLTPASDLFSLGAVLYEVLTYKAMFRDKTPLKTIARVRRAEVTTQLLEVKEILPGLDRVLYRALSLNQRHRYQRAFVLREDLRGLMAGYSFSNIKAEARVFLEPMFQGRTRAIDEVLPQLPPSTSTNENTQSLLLDESVSGVSLSDVKLMPPHPEPELPTEEEDDDDTGTLDSLNMKLRDALTEDGATDPTGSFTDPQVTKPFSKEPDRGPAQPVGLGPSDLVEFGYDGPLGTGSEELAIIDADIEPSGDLARPEPAPHQTSFEAEVSFPQGVDDPEPRAYPTPTPIDQPERYEAPGYDDTDPEWDSGGPSGPMIAGAMLAGVLGVLVVFCAGGSLLGAVGAAQVARSSGGTSGVTEPAEVVALPAEPSLVARAEQAEDPPVVEKARPVASPRPKARPTPTVRPTPTARPRQPRPARPAAPSVQTRPQPRTFTPDPVAARPVPMSQPVAQPMSAPIVQPDAVAMAAPSADPTLNDADWDVDMMVAEELSPLTLADPPPTTEAVPPEDLGAFATAAYGGQLSPTDQAALQAMPRDDLRFSRSRVLLYQDAKAKGDTPARRRWMGELMQLEENTYRPELLVEEAAVAMDDRDYETALARANRAEQYWSRLPSDLIFTRKAMIHEIQAQASWALYTKSDPPREALLDGSIDAWNRYRTHVLGASRSDLVQRADERITHLGEVRKRMH